MGQVKFMGQIASIYPTIKPKSFSNIVLNSTIETCSISLVRNCPNLNSQAGSLQELSAPQPLPIAIDLNHQSRDSKNPNLLIVEAHSKLIKFHENTC